MVSLPKRTARRSALRNALEIFSCRAVEIRLTRGAVESSERHIPPVRARRRSESKVIILSMCAKCIYEDVKTGSLYDQQLEQLYSIQTIIRYLIH
jgi:hypothetical protein